MTLVAPPMVPARDRATAADRILPVGLALVAHLALALLLLWHPHRPAPQPPRETPVELVPEPPPAAAKPEAAKPPPAPKSSPAPKTSPAAAKTAGKAGETRAEARKPPPRTPDPPRAVKPAAPPAAPPAGQGDVAERMRQLLGAMPAIVLPGASDAGSEAVSYKALVLSQVGKAKKEGRSKGVPGVATVGFTLDDRGGLARCEILRKSVDAALDAEALAMVRRGAPYPAPPPGADRDFTISLRFSAMP